jgi:hypothetical protein
MRLPAGISGGIIRANKEGCIMSKICPVCKKNTIKNEEAPKCLECVRTEYKEKGHRIVMARMSAPRDRIVLTRSE